MADKPPGEKTEQPTQKRLDDTRKKGEVARSKELGPAIITLAAAGWFALFGATLIDACRAIVARGLDFSPRAIAEFEPARAATDALLDLAAPMAGLFTACLVAALVGGGLLGGAAFNVGLMAPKFERMNPIAGLGRMFGPKGLTELAKALAKVIVVGAVSVWAVLALGEDFVAIARADTRAALVFAGDRALWLFTLLGAGLLLVAAVDAPIALFRHLAKLRMTRQEVRDEHKEQEGSPELKAQQRRRQREARRPATSAAVASAQVVVTNPSHFAVALRYRRAEDAAPVVVASGRGERAAMIRAAAAEHGVTLLAEPQLARALYFTARPGAPIHPDLYAAVAAVLAFVFAIDRGQRPRPPVVEVPPPLRYDERGRRPRA